MLGEYEELDAVAIAALIATGETTATEVLETAIALAQERNGTINAIVTPMYEAAREVAAAHPTGPLGGVPFLIKDLAYVAGTRCSFGSRLWQDYVPDHDADIVKRYRAAGLVLFGKTNTPEVGLAATTEPVFLGPCRNPWDLSRSTGGSSGGAAAAVAARILPVAHATDGGGSIRIPASCCGLVGLKPTRARTPLGPDVGEGWGSMATAHVVSRSVRDSAALLDATHGPAQGDPYHAPPFEGSYLSAHQSEPGRLRVAIDLRPINGGPVSAECRDGIESAARLLASLGHHVEEVDMDYDRESLGMAAGALVMANVRNNILRRAEALGVTPSPDNTEALTLRFVEMGAGITGETYARAINQIHATTRWMEGFFTKWDLVMSPTLLSPPPPLGFMDTSSDDGDTYAAHFNTFWGFTNLYNATGHPAISLPLHWTDEGLPVGIQFAAPFGNELRLLQLARQLEVAAPWADRRPPLIT
ncbi:MAG: amidase [Pseudomonadales bacterium]|nr:amidase [Pseudomonadales bacterium]